MIGRAAEAQTTEHPEETNGSLGTSFFRSRFCSLCYQNSSAYMHSQGRHSETHICQRRCWTAVRVCSHAAAAAYSPSEHKHTRAYVHTKIRSNCTSGKKKEEGEKPKNCLYIFYYSAALGWMRRVCTYEHTRGVRVFVHAPISAKVSTFPNITYGKKKRYSEAERLYGLFVDVRL